MKIKILKISLFIGACYFLLMAITHALGQKIPGLFIYFNVPSYTYQDKIISALAFGWAVFLFTGFKTLSRSIIKSVLMSGAFAIIMLIFTNFSTNFNAISEQIKVYLFHIETGLLLIYWLWLLIWYCKSKENLNL
jgi:hypothetical protein